MLLWRHPTVIDVRRSIRARDDRPPTVHGDSLSNHRYLSGISRGHRLRSWPDPYLGHMFSVSLKTAFRLCPRSCTRFGPMGLHPRCGEEAGTRESMCAGRYHTWARLGHFLWPKELDLIKFNGSMHVRGMFASELSNLVGRSLRNWEGTKMI
jgi:hypothetical protein